MTRARRCYLFRQGDSAGNAGMKQLLGGKGANLCEMARLGLNVPPGLTVTTEACQEFQKGDGQLPGDIWAEIQATLKDVEAAFGTAFASTTELPLLLSVRSGAAVSMPGMMDTVLNLGLNDRVVEALAAHTSRRLALDCYRRLLDMYANVVLGADHELFEAALAEVKAARRVRHDVELTDDALEEVVTRFKAVYKAQGYELPEDPYEQLRAAVCAVFRSWNTPRARRYRELNGITGLRGTAVNIQTMVYGNFNDQSGTGVCFTRNPATGENALFGEFLINAQGEDVVAGIRTPQPIQELRTAFPKVYEELHRDTQRLERHLRNMQDCEFTVQDQTLWILQTRSGKRTGMAALQVATDMKKDGLLTEAEAVLMVEPRHLEQLLHPQFASPGAFKDAIVAHGLAASPGAGVGRLVFTADDAEAWRARGERVILARTDTSPEDVGGMHAAEGVLTSRGGMTSHAAVVARGWGKPCVCGCESLSIDIKAKVAHVKRHGQAIEIREGDWISLDGTSGAVILGKQELTEPSISGRLEEFMTWVDAARRLRVKTNADTPADAQFARAHGAEGIGLVRTEHMFFSTPARIAAVRRMIASLQLDPQHSQKAISDIEAFQTEDFEAIFRACDGLPVTVRLLDPPLHEFLPHAGRAMDALTAELAGQLGVAEDKVRSELEGLHESNPMMGFRGCRLGIVRPQITEMQVRAIIQAAINAQKAGVRVAPEIMVPLVGFETELANQIAIVRAAARAVIEAPGGQPVPFKVGSMIEVPRACLIADKLAPLLDFASFGTNDLTQMTLGFSRDDAEAHFLGHYAKQGIVAFDPFQRVDEEGVGALMAMAAGKMAAGEASGAHGKVQLGVCGEHGGDPDSIEFINGIPGMDYVSCSPLRVPIARLAAAHAQLKLEAQARG